MYRTVRIRTVSRNLFLLKDLFLFVSCSYSEINELASCMEELSSRASATVDTLGVSGITDELNKVRKKLPDPFEIEAAPFTRTSGMHSCLSQI